MQGEAFVFINWIQAARLGHVGWGFRLNGDGTCFFGSTDHLIRHGYFDLPGWIRYAHLEPHKDNDWWSAQDSYDHMLADMRDGHHIRYHSLKSVAVSTADPERAVAAARSLASGGWSVLANNCVHQTYRVLTEYGASIPEPASPLTNLIPRVWFSRLEGKRLDLNPIK